ncbi:hypothetical protein [Desulfatibacillum aliphaticivorans]|uniref:hypothetical protein n=1 Tax=Desulfatibacillum aliphaticivorans TaxID=218208 RepID=UPI0004193AAE|nr:hypothetical protein [Desulfatibacillum aliphaticivorans]
MIRLKYAAAIVLIICFFLPLSRCGRLKYVVAEPPNEIAQSVGEKPADITPNAVLEKQVKQSLEPKYRIEEDSSKRHKYFIP